MFQAAVESLWKQQEFDFCDGLRAVAVLWVCIDHGVRLVEFNNPYMRDLIFRPWWPVAVPSSGEAGVDLFLVLSGFLMGSALYREMSSKGSLSWKQFYIRRAFRIFPACFSAMFITIVSDFLTETRATCPNQTWWRNLFVFNNMGEAEISCMGHTWSVGLELQLYFATPLLVELAGALSRSSLPKLSPMWWIATICAMGWVICCIIRLVFVLSTDLLNQPPTSPYWIQVYLNTQYRYATYAAGVVAGCIVVEEQKTKSTGDADGVGSRAVTLARRFFPFAPVVVACSCIFGGDLSAVSDPEVTAWYRTELAPVALLHVAFLRPLVGAAVASVLMLSALGLAPRTSAFLALPFWRPVAGLAYSMYLLQFVAFQIAEKPYLNVVGPFLADAPMWLGILFTYFGALLLVLACLPIALLNYTFIERPGIRAGKCVCALFARAGAKSGSGQQQAKPSSTPAVAATTPVSSIYGASPCNISRVKSRTIDESETSVLRRAGSP